MAGKAGEAARSAQHAPGNLDNRHVEIVRAASARVNVSVLYQFIDTANRPWPTWRRSAAGFLRRAARGSVSRKMACRPAAGDTHSGSRPSTRAQRRGSLVAAPSNRERGWTPRRATLLCSPTSGCDFNLSSICSCVL
jgi:hypothetical protein